MEFIQIRVESVIVSGGKKTGHLRAPLNNLSNQVVL
jgi:hypothetical protein